MRTILTVTICATAQIIGVAASHPAGAERGRRLTPHQAVRHVGPLTVRRHARRSIEVTSDFDPVPPDPVVIDFFRGVEGYGADGAANALSDRAQPFGPRALRNF